MFNFKYRDGNLDGRIVVKANGVTIGFYMKPAPYTKLYFFYNHGRSMFEFETVNAMERFISSAEQFEDIRYRSSGAA